MEVERGESIGKGKPRHNPNKPANLKGGFCGAYDGITCHGGSCYDIKKCNGNPHNCLKTLYARAASRSDKQINDDVLKRR